MHITGVDIIVSSANLSDTDKDYPVETLGELQSTPFVAKEASLERPADSEKKSGR